MTGYVASRWGLILVLVINVLNTWGGRFYVLGKTSIVLRSELTRCRLGVCKSLAWIFSGEQYAPMFASVEITPSSRWSVSSLSAGEGIIEDLRVYLAEFCWDEMVMISRPDDPPSFWTYQSNRVMDRNAVGIMRSELRGRGRESAKDRRCLRN